MTTPTTSSRAAQVRRGFPARYKRSESRDPAARNVRVMDDGFSRLPDEVHGARAAGSLLAGDLESAEAELARVRARYLVRFLCRLAVVTPEVSLRLAWHVASPRGWLWPPRAR